MSNVPPSAASLRGAVDLSSLVNRPDPQAAQPAAGGAPGTGGAGARGGVPAVVVEVNDASFSAVLELSNTVPVLVDLAADWSEQSTQLSALLEKITLEHAGRIVLAHVDAEANPQLAQAFQAQSVPTVAAVIGGRPMGLFVGLLPEDQLRDVFEQVLAFAAQNGVTGTVPFEAAAEGEPAGEPEPEPLPPHHQDAYDAIERGDYEAAKQAYSTAIAQDPRDQLAVAGLAQVSLLARLQGVSMADVRSAAAAGPTDVEAQLGVADLDLSGGHVVDAFDRLLTLFPSLDADGKNAVRTRLLEYFEIVGSDTAEVGAARRRLTMLLY